MKDTKSQRTKELVERIGVAAEHTGFPPAVGRVLAALLVSDPPFLTFDEIQNYLGISKSAVSNALSTLTSREIVDYITLPGERKRRFHVTAPGIMAHITKRMQLRAGVPDLIREVVASRSARYPEFNASLNELLEFLSFMDREIQAGLEKWQLSKRKRNLQK